MGIEGIQLNKNTVSVYQPADSPKQVSAGKESGADAVTGMASKKAAVARERATDVPFVKRKPQMPDRIRTRAVKGESGKAQATEAAPVKETQAKPERNAKDKQVVAEKKADEDKSKIDYMGTSAKFSYNKDIDRIVITITDNANDKVLKEIPSEDTQKMLARIHKMTGMVMDEEV